MDNLLVVLSLAVLPCGVAAADGVSVALGVIFGFVLPVSIIACCIYFCFCKKSHSSSGAVVSYPTTTAVVIRQPPPPPPPPPTTVGVYERTTLLQTEDGVHMVRTQAAATSDGDADVRQQIYSITK